MTAESSPELQKLGSSLLEARLREGLSLEELAQRLHMGREQLHSLEQADPAGLPEPVFIVAQARRVACALGVNVDQEIQAVRQSQGSGASPSKLPTSLRPTSSSAAQPGETRSGRPTSAAEPPSLPSAPARPQVTTLRPRAGGPSRWGRVLGGLLLISGLGVVAVLGWRTVSVTGNPPQRPDDTVLPPPAHQAAGEIPTLRLLTRQSSWLEVRREDGSTLYRGTLRGERSFPLNSDLLVLAGRPDLVQVTVTGSSARPLGPIDQVRWERFRAPAP